MKLNTIALRTLGRNRRRTMITAFSVAFGIFLAVTLTGSGDYSYSNMIDTSAVMGFGHVSIEAAGYNDKPSLSRWFPEADRVRRAAEEPDAVIGAYPRIIGQAMFAAGAKNSGAMFMAVDPGRENPGHNFFLRSIVDGEMFQDSEGRGALIGVEMAEKLNLRPGKKVVITLTDRDGQLTSELLLVSGLFATGDLAADSGMVLVPLDRMRHTLGYGEDGTSLVAVYVDDQRKVGTIRDQLAENLAGGPDVEVLTWHETQPDLSGLIAVDRLFNYLMQLLVALVIAAGITNTMLMSVLERTREFGIMMALGMTPGQIVRMVLVESFWLGCLGVVLGILLTIPWYYFMTRTGIDLGRYVGEDYSAGGVLVDPVLKLRLFKESAAAILATVFFLTLAAAVYPAIRAGRILPVETIKEI
ncbi:MAG: FtsX-like permease family protein [Desulfobulbaceae bacterium]|nr:FtsX-like permease family protein [Desulfobulbaceae bacterium]